MLALRRALLPVAAAIVCALMPAAVSLAQQDSKAAAPPAETVQQRQEREFRTAIEAVKRAAKDGPVDVPLIDQGTFKVPAGYVFVPREEAAQLMRAMGNRTGANFLGLVLSGADGLNWFATLTHTKSGYVKDDDAKNWNADELLSQLKSGTESGNSDRMARGFPAVEVTGWVERPAYDAPTHRLVWSALLRRKGASEAEPASVNYNTYALGREGYYQLNLISDSKRIDKDKVHAPPLLAALTYTEGKRYEDFQPGTDRVAEYGLAALIAGAAAKKLGLFALIGAFFLKFWKLAAIGLVVAGGAVAKLFGRRQA